MVNQISILSTTLLMLLLATFQGAGFVSAQAPQSAQRSAQYHSLTGDTVFPEAAAGACAGDIISYTTHFQGTSYTGVLQVRSPSGTDCDGGRGRVVSGFFEEKDAAVFGGSTDRGQWCSGRLTLTLNQGHGDSSARWQNIHAAPGFNCSGSDAPLDLPLIYTDSTR
jgi:hypothetical protein